MKNLNVTKVQWCRLGNYFQNDNHYLSNIKNTRPECNIVRYRAVQLYVANKNNEPESYSDPIMPYYHINHSFQKIVLKLNCTSPKHS